MADNLPILHTSLMVEDLDGQWTAVRDPITGEIVRLDDPPRLADWLISLKAHRAALSEASAEVQRALLPAMDRDASWTMNRPGGSVSAPSPARSVAADAWDGNKLYDVLGRLVEENIISEQARSSAVKIETEYTAIAKGVKALLAIPDVAPYVESCRVSEEPKKRSVSVK